MGAKGESFRELVQLQRKMNQLFEEMLQPDGPTTRRPGVHLGPRRRRVRGRRATTSWSWNCPGCRSTMWRSSARETSCAIAGERKPLVELTRESVQRMERYVGPFGSEFSFPEALDSTQRRGAAQDGVLSVNIPKGSGRTIQVG